MAAEKSGKKKRKQLSPRQLKLIKERAKGKSYAQAAIAAGFPRILRSTRSKGSRAIRREGGGDGYAQATAPADQRHALGWETTGRQHRPRLKAYTFPYLIPLQKGRSFYIASAVPLRRTAIRRHSHWRQGMTVLLLHSIPMLSSVMMRRRPQRLRNESDDSMPKNVGGAFTVSANAM